MVARPARCFRNSESAVQSAAVAIYSDTLQPPSAEDNRKSSSGSAAFFFTRNTVGGKDLNPTYFRAAHAPKAIWKVPEAGHTDRIR